HCEGQVAVPLAVIHVGVGGEQKNPLRTRFADYLANPRVVSQVDVFDGQRGQLVPLTAQLRNQIMAKQSGGTEQGDAHGGIVNGKVRWRDGCLARPAGRDARLSTGDSSRLYSLPVGCGVRTRRRACRMSDPLMPKQTTAANATRSSARRVIRRRSANSDAMAQRMPRTLSQRGE